MGTSDFCARTKIDDDSKVKSSLFAIVLQKCTKHFPKESLLFGIIFLFQSCTTFDCMLIEKKCAWKQAFNLLY